MFFKTALLALVGLIASGYSAGPCFTVIYGHVLTVDSLPVAGVKVIAVGTEGWRDTNVTKGDDGVFTLMRAWAGGTGTGNHQTATFTPVLDGKYTFKPASYTGKIDEITIMNCDGQPSSYGTKYKNFIFIATPVVKVSPQRHLPVITAVKSKLTYFDISGRIVNGDHKGIVIIKTADFIGRKVIVR